MTNVWLHDASIDRDVASIFDPFGNAVHTALSFPVLGEDVLITGAGPIGCMAAAVITHRFHYTDFEKAFDVMMSGQSEKVILNWA